MSRLEGSLCVPVLLLLSRSVVSDSVTPWTAALQVSLSFPISQSLLKLMSIESMMPLEGPDPPPDMEESVQVPWNPSGWGFIHSPTFTS